MLVWLHSPQLHMRMSPLKKRLDIYSSRLLLRKWWKAISVNLISSRDSSSILHGMLHYVVYVSTNRSRAHYQAKPKRYIQHLHLATSIISDLRLDKPRRPKLWSAEGGKDKNKPD